MEVTDHANHGKKSTPNIYFPTEQRLRTFHPGDANELLVHNKTCGRVTIFERTPCNQRNLVQTKIVSINLLDMRVASLALIFPFKPKRCAVNRTRGGWPTGKTRRLYPGKPHHFRSQCLGF